MISTSSLKIIMLLLAVAATPCLAQLKSTGPLTPTAAATQGPTPKPTPDPRVADEDDRGILPEKFVEKRRRRSSGGPRTSATYRQVTPGPGTGGPDTRKSGPITPTEPRYGQLGLTVWRLRKSASVDAGPHLMAPDKSGTIEWTPLRVETATPFAVDDRLRLSFESSMKGHLYVIDRGQYKDGTMSVPKLIFPTTSIRGGDNSVEPGHLIEIPAQSDHSPWFNLRSTRGELVAELLTVIVSKEPIAGLAEQIGPGELVLDEALVAKWQSTWAGRVERYELKGGEGRPWTKAEQDAGADATRELTQDDAPPQTIFRVAHIPGAPMLVSFQLQVRPAGPTP